MSSQLPLGLLLLSGGLAEDLRLDPHRISCSQGPLELAQSPRRLQRAGWFARSALICVLWF